jgi:pullulanase/glycogen debranching enzyme
MHAQGFGTGLYTDPNDRPAWVDNPATRQYGGADELVALGRAMDLVALGLVGNLRSYRLTCHDGVVRRGDEIFYGAVPAGYADEPDEALTYVDAHDNETLFDIGILKLPVGTSMADRVRMNTLMLATAALAQTACLWHAGTDLLRSKSLDRNSYNSGDWFNAIDWSGSDNGFGRGLPSYAENGARWPILAPLLRDDALLPTPEHIRAARAQAFDLLRLRRSLPRLRLGSAALIRERVTFPLAGPAATPGVIVMHIADHPDVKPGSFASPTDALRGAREADVKLGNFASPTDALQGAQEADVKLGNFASPTDALQGAQDSELLVVFNATRWPVSQTIPALAGHGFALASAQQAGADPVVRETGWDEATGTVRVPARTVAVLVARRA